MKPILKWAGGKRGLLSDIERNLPNDIKGRTYHEIFFGGGALFFYIEPKKGTINDVNQKLMNFYNVVKNNPKKLISLAEGYQKYAKDEKKYYLLRDEFNYNNNGDIKSAALFLYFNRASYNGLYRVNSKGYFNVPFGRHKNPKIVNDSRIMNAHNLLKNIKIYCNDFEYILDIVKEGDVCYLDPPYYQSNMTNKFTNYSKNGFTFDDHIRLKDVCVELNKIGVSFILSNSNAPRIVNLYEQEGFQIINAKKKWMISCNAESRKEVNEIIVINGNFL